MFDFYQKRKLRTVINSRYTQGVILALVLFVGWSAYIRFDIAMEMKDRREVAQQQAAALLERKNALQERVEYLSNDRGLEAEMRRQFDVALEGEQVVVLVAQEDDGPQVQPLSTSTPKEEKRWYQFWR